MKVKENSGCNCAQGNKHAYWSFDTPKVVEWSTQITIAMDVLVAVTT